MTLPILTEFELSAPVLVLLFHGRCPPNALLQLRQSEYGLLALEMLGIICSGAGVLFLLYLEQDRTSVKYFGAGVRESRITQQFWKKCWNGNMLLSPPSGEETQNHSFLASCRKNRRVCVQGFVEDKLQLVSKCLHMFLFVLYTFLLAVLELFCFILACHRTFEIIKDFCISGLCKQDVIFFPLPVFLFSTLELFLEIFLLLHNFIVMCTNDEWMQYTSHIYTT